jgi:hypothetical protein
MQLIYRGKPYHYNPAESEARHIYRSIFELSYELTYRARTYWLTPTVRTETSVESVIHKLKYRGTTYQMCCNGQRKMV